METQRKWHEERDKMNAVMSEKSQCDQQTVTLFVSPKTNKRKIN